MCGADLTLELTDPNDRITSAMGHRMGINTRRANG